MWLGKVAFTQSYIPRTNGVMLDLEGAEDKASRTLVTAVTLFTTPIVRLVTNDE